MKQPEAQIGQTAHDFVQAFGNATVKLLWSRRVGDAPGTPSRWLHRLLMILETAKLKRQRRARGRSYARRLAEPAAVTPVAMPKPRPPVALRPKGLSVTRIEKLIRDPYAIYARYILQLEPVKPVSSRPRPGAPRHHLPCRDRRFPHAVPEAPAGRCRSRDSSAMAAGIFARSRTIPASSASGGRASAASPRGSPNRSPSWREGVERVVAECNGGIAFPVAGEDFSLTCRADRIDLMADGSARIVDYKTGGVPSTREVEAGLAPQLTLQAAILARGGFTGMRRDGDGEALVREAEWRRSCRRGRDAEEARASGDGSRREASRRAAEAARRNMPAWSSPITRAPS